MKAADLLHAYVSRHNEGVRTGNFHSMLALFHPEAELYFEGLQYGPFRGLGAIAEAFEHHPPRAELRILSSSQENAGAEATYSSEDGPRKVAGSLRIEADSGKIRRLVISAVPS